MKFIIILMLTLFLASCTPVKDSDILIKKNEIANLKGLKLGAKLTLKKTTKISEILKNPNKFINKKVLVKGTVTSLCSRRGCWMEIVGTEVGERIRIKVRDGVIVFPMSAKGKDAYVEGTVFSINVRNRNHKKPACGQEHKEGSGCEQKVAANIKTIYQIQGIGAIILD